MKVQTKLKQFTTLVKGKVKAKARRKTKMMLYTSHKSLSQIWPSDKDADATPESNTEIVVTKSTNKNYKTNDQINKSTLYPILPLLPNYFLFITIAQTPVFSVLYTS